MASKSKSKGSSWEREVASFLTETYNEPFMRVPNSGAYTGGKNSSRKMLMSDGQIRHMKGDIVPPDDWIKFNCECKNYKSFPFHRLLFDEPIPQLEEWLQQIKDAADKNDNNILFMKITRIGKFVVFDSKLPLTSKRSIVYYDKDNVEWIVTEFHSFFTLNKDTFKEIHNHKYVGNSS